MNAEKKVYVITGCSSGLGRELCRTIRAAGNHVVGIGKDHPTDGTDTDEYIRCDLEDPEQIRRAADAVLVPVDVLINCAGINEINYLEDLTLMNWDRVMNVNARAIYLLSRAFLAPLIESRGTIVNIISNASHQPMTASLVYNASKGAAHIMTLQLARELTKRHDITVFGVSPNKMAGTGMSRYIEGHVSEVRGWTPEVAAAYQRQSLLAGEETPPEVVAEFVSYLLSSKRTHKHLTGCVIPYGA